MRDWPLIKWMTRKRGRLVGIKQFILLLHTHRAVYSLWSGDSDKQTGMFALLIERNEINPARSISDVLLSYICSHMYILWKYSYDLDCGVCFTAAMLNSVSSRHFRHTSRKLCFYCGPSPAQQRWDLKETVLSCHGTTAAGGKPHLAHKTRAPSFPWIIWRIQSGNN